MPEQAQSIKTNERYELVTRLATGGMAELFLARERGLAGLERLVVIKRILPHLADQSSFIDMFLREARIAARLNHPNIIHVFELGQENDSYFIAMEYVHGSTVREIQLLAARQQKHFPLGVSLSIIEQACRGLHAAHELRDLDGSSLGLVHRDISPQNLMCTTEGHIKLLDFGVAKASEGVDSTYSGNLKGKFAYLSPEQCMHQDLDRRSDIFSLGIILWELCTGKRLFKRRTELEMMQAIIKGDVPSPRSLKPNIPLALEQVILKALHLDKAQRFATADEFRLALLRIINDVDPSNGEDAIASFLQRVAGEQLDERQITLQKALDRSLTSNERKRLLHITGSSPHMSSGDELSAQTAIERPSTGEGLAERSVSHATGVDRKSITAQSPGPLSLPKKNLIHPHESSLSISREKIDSWQVDEVYPLSSVQRARKVILWLIVVVILSVGAIIAGHEFKLFSFLPMYAISEEPDNAILLGEPLPLGWAPIIGKDALIKEIQPLHDYLEKELGRPIPLIYAQDYNELTQMLRDGDIAFAVLPPYLYIDTVDTVDDAELLVIKEYDGGINSDALLLVSAQSTISSLAQLRDATFCLIDPSSTSGNFMPRAYIREQGYDPDKFIGEVHWSGDHMQALRDLNSGVCDAAATYSGAFLSADEFGVPMGQIRTLAVTGHIPQDTITAGPIMTSVERHRVRQALLKFHPQTDLGIRSLGNSQRITGFSEGNDADFNALRAAIRAEKNKQQ